MNNAEIDDLKALVKEQQKTISNLTEAVKKLTEHQLQAGKATLPQDVSRQAMQCFRSGAYGHMAMAWDQPGPSLRSMEVQLVEIDEAAGSEVVELSLIHI